MSDDRPWLLDLFCGAGGAAYGYHQAGFNLCGIDINRQPNYPYKFIQADVMEFCANPKFPWHKFSAVHASPPCQSYTRKSANWGRERTHYIDHPDLLEPTRAILQATGLPYVIENVEGSPILESLMLCGTMFGLPLIKHRYFEMNFLCLPASVCDHSNVYNPWSGEGRSAEKMREAMGTPWIPISGGASRKAGVTGDLFNAIPPAYTKFIGTQLMVEVLARG